MTETGTKLNPKDLATITVLIVSAFVVILNETIMNVALPVLMHEFQVSEEAIQWLATIFMLTMAVVIPATGFLLQRFSTRGVFMLAMGLFSLGTLLAAAAPGFGLLLVARVIQASGTAIMMPLLMTTILDLVPAHRRGVIMGNVSIVISVAPAIGPTISGLILHSLSWRFMFLIVAPIALAALFIGSPRLNKVAEASTMPLSIPSVLLSIPAFGGLVFGLSRLSANGLDGQTLSILVVAVLSLVAFTMLQLRLQKKNHALLDLRTFTYRPFTLSLSLMVLAMVALFGVIILLPLYLQNVRGLDTLATGLMLLPGGLLMGLLAPFVGRLFDRVGPRPLMIPGTVILVLMLFGYSRLLGAETALGVIVALHLTMSLALSLIFTPAFTTALNPLPHSLHSHGSAVLSTLQQLGGAAGTALLVGVLASRIGAGAAAGADPIQAQIDGFSAGFLVASICAVGMVVIALFLTKAREPAPATAAEHAH
ncbi:DHA2 family efflux MFS transporter permease subunit [Paeniglutamicibacter sp. ZC-3]|uniref:DHA2 family efflux MFS transporter permease subunit n=1 Tax=Paeniglutamicibacter sp. ZC-3 TaxID=2986919 RepID=UPI0021F7494A|nr:DHA2 family efflux MFS transporter permease subunit [Paeniglutamicibacter sp. ZC-3]MCV9994645.1 DHA2 family efflux MFS transporter permease subunit [Paeniglutamicibacter sp. ZC-3]